MTQDPQGVDPCPPRPCDHQARDRALDRLGFAAGHGGATVSTGLPFPFVPFSGIDDWFITSLVLGLAHLVYGGILGPAYATLSRSVPVGNV